jgi:UDP-N-acetylmuramyl-tripeptide synthetase
VRADLDGIELALDGRFGRARLRSKLVGDFNAENLVCALGTLVADGMTLGAASEALGLARSAPGRMDVLGGPPAAPRVVVDYAHTPDALERTLRVVKSQVRGKVLCVFGCGGDRDRGKRPLMGAIAARLADRVLVTSDNPRGEDPLEIISQIRKGAAKALDSEADRALAIREIITASNDNDVVLIAGKGHEDYQEIAGRRTHFSDEEHARAALARRAG